MSKVCVVSSCGGHLTEVRRLMPAYENYEHFYVLNDEVMLPTEMKGKTFFISHSERDWRFLLNLWEAWRICFQERPDVILSTGAGPVVPFAIVGQYLFGAKVIFVETITRVTEPSLTGRIMYHLADSFFYQNKSLERFFPRGTYGGPVI